MKTGIPQDSTQIVQEHLQPIWKMLTDDEDTCYESDDKRFYAALRQKYGIGRKELSYLRTLQW